MALTDNLISYWKMDEASGNAIDAHGSNDLADNNTVGSATGKINNGRDFEAGNSEFFSHASNSDLQTGDIDFTFAAWINAESLAGTTLIFGKDVDTSREYWLTADGTIIRWTWTSDVNAEISFTATGSWHYVVVWHDATANTINLQLDNGTPVSNPTTGLFPAVGAAEFRIGARAFPSFEGYWDGLIDEVGFWKRVLTTQERTDLYNSGAGYSYDIWGGGTPPTIILMGDQLN